MPFEILCGRIPIEAESLIESKQCPVAKFLRQQRFGSMEQMSRERRVVKDDVVVISDGFHDLRPFTCLNRGLLIARAFAYLDLLLALFRTQKIPDREDAGSVVCSFHVGALFLDRAHAPRGSPVVLERAAFRHRSRFSLYP